MYEDPIDDESAPTAASVHPKQLVELKEASDATSHAEAPLEDTAQLSSHLPQECSSSASTSSCSLCHCGAPGRQHRYTVCSFVVAYLYLLMYFYENCEILY